MSVVNAKCPNCGASIQLDNERTEGFCSYCGSKVKVEEAQKLLIQGTVKVDTSDELANLYQIARRAKDANNSESAYKYYDMILVKDPNSWEATFYVTYYQAMQCKIGEIHSAAGSLCDIESIILDLVKTNVPLEEQQAVVQEISDKLIEISGMLSGAALNHYLGIDSSIQDEFYIDFMLNMTKSAKILYDFGDLLETTFGVAYKNIFVNLWKESVDILASYMNTGNSAGFIELVEMYKDKISKYEPNYSMPTIVEKSDSGCYIATSIYGSYDCPEVWILRRFRDNTLNNYLLGKCFIKTYYTISPSLVKWFGSSLIFKRTFTPMLNKLVSKLRNKGFSDSPYQDKK